MDEEWLMEGLRKIVKLLETMCKHLDSIDERLSKLESKQ